MQCRSSKDRWGLGNKRCVNGKHKCPAEPYALALSDISRKDLTGSVCVLAGREMGTRGRKAGK